MASYRRFCNKIYQATKYVLGKLPADFKPRATGVPTGDESLAERWILHKLNAATRSANDALERREFSRSTQAVYQYWYDHLCDVYIVSRPFPTNTQPQPHRTQKFTIQQKQENSKTIIQTGTPAAAHSAVQTLYTTLTSGLTLLHPFMPFLTEELWQRLPRRPGDATPSILLAAYPEPDPHLDDPASEAAYELVLGCSKGVRSLLAEYGIKDRGRAFVQALDPTAHATAEAQRDAIKTLVGRGCGSLEVLGPGEERPAGCAVFPVSAQAAAYVYVKGLVDVGAEISKAEGRLNKAREGEKKQVRLVGDLEGKAGEAVVEGERARLRDMRAEVGALESAIEQFERLKVEEEG